MDTENFSASPTEASASAVIINADDLGIGQERDDGIIHMFKSKRVSSASLMMNTPSTDSAIAKAREAGLPCGLHVNLTEGKPVLPKESVSSFVDEEGKMLGKQGFRHAILIGSVSISQVKAEISAQLHQFIQAFGELPTHADGHQHVHVIPAVAPVFASCLREVGVRCTRVPTEDPQPMSWITPPARKLFYATIRDEALSSCSIFADMGLCWPRWAGFGIMGNDCTIERVESILNRQAELACAGKKEPLEIMVHVGYKGSGWDDFNCSDDREIEMQVWQAIQWPKVLKLCSYECMQNLGRPSPHRLPIPPVSCQDDPITWHGREQKAVLLSKLLPGTGNAVTASRIQRCLQPLFEQSILLQEENDFPDAESFELFAEEQNISAVIAVHAYRSGRLLSNWTKPYLLVLGGTDVNVDLYDSVKREIVLDCIQRAAAVTAFHPALIHQVTAACIDQGMEVNRLPAMHVITQWADPPLQTDVHCNSSPPAEFCLHDKTGFPRDAPIILFAGALRPVKAVEFLLDAISKQSQEGYCEGSSDIVHMAIAGQFLDHGDYKEQVENAVARSLGRVKLCCHVPHDVLMHWMTQAVALVNTSVSEGMSGAILEAMAAGLPVLARAIEGNCNLVKHETNGLVFCSAQEALDQARLLHRNVEYSTLLSEQARIYVAHEHAFSRARMHMQSAAEFAFGDQSLPVTAGVCDKVSEQPPLVPLHACNNLMNSAICSASPGAIDLILLVLDVSSTSSCIAAARAFVHERTCLPVMTVVVQGNERVSWKWTFWQSSAKNVSQNVEWRDFKGKCYALWNMAAENSKMEELVVETMMDAGLTAHVV